MKDEDLSVAGLGSPASLGKLIKVRKGQPSEQSINVIIDNDAIGIENDTEDYMTINISDCLEQADFYISSFNGKAISAWMFRYLDYLFGSGKYLKNTNQEIADLIKKDDDIDYITIVNKIKYAKNNLEVKSMIGFIILLAGGLNVAKKQGKQVGFFLDYVDSHLHPQRSYKFMTLLNQIKKDYE